VGFLVDLVAFLKLALKKIKKTGVSLVGFNYTNPEDNYGRLIDFLSQISKLFYFNMNDLADFIMHHHKVSRFVFVLMQSHTCA